MHSVSQYVPTNYCDTNREQKQHVRFAASVITTITITGSEVFQTSSAQRLYCDISYCLRKIKLIPIVLYDITDVKCESM
jgi:hypothetical protein